MKPVIPGSLEGAARFRETRRVTAWGLFSNMMLSAAKITGGAIWGSHALVADGVNSLSDCVSDVAILIGAIFWSKPSDDTHPHGHARIETMVAGFVGLLIIATGAMLAWESFDAVINPAHYEVGWMVFIIAVASVISKEALYRWTILKSRQLRSPALAAKAWDHRSDCLSSIPVALVVIAIRISPSLDHLDGIAGGVVAVFILRTGIRILKPALWQLTDSAAPVEVREELLSIARGVPGVLDIHDLRTRYQGDGVQADMHIVVEADLPLIKAFAIGIEVEKRLRSSGTGVVDALVRLEPDRQE